MGQLKSYIRALHRDQRAVSTVEFALVSIPLLILLLGTFDIGLGIWTYNNLAEAARGAARYAIVRGQQSPLGAVGPAPEGPATCDVATGPVSRRACARAFPLDPSKLEVKVEWPDGGNSLQQSDTVVVTVRYRYTPLLFNFLKFGTVNLRSQSKMLIACCG
jgi:hypothetical protein